jgi:hypothetical protein
MNRKIAIFGFAIVWVTVIIAAVVMIQPVLHPEAIGNNTAPNTLKEQGLLNDTAALAANKEENFFFYEKKVFIRHYRNEIESESLPATTITRSPVIFKPIIKKVKPVVVQNKIQTTHDDFDIKPVPIQHK